MKHFAHTSLKHKFKRAAAEALTMCQCTTFSEIRSFNISKVSDAPLHTMSKLPDSRNCFYIACISIQQNKIKEKAPTSNVQNVMFHCVNLQRENAGIYMSSMVFQNKTKYTKNKKEHFITSKELED